MEPKIKQLLLRQVRPFLTCLCTLAFLVSTPALAQTSSVAMPIRDEVCRPTPRATRHIVPADKKISYTGRWDKKDVQAYKTDRGGAYLQINFTGDYVAVHMQNGGPHIWWRSSIDGDAWQRLSGGNLIAPLRSKGRHTLVLERDTEDLGGISTLTGITLAAEGKLLPPPKPKKRYLEFVGDSVLTGAFNLGTEGKGYLVHESSAQSFGPLTARKLNADYSIIATSGEGVVQNHKAATGARKYVYIKDDYERLLYNDSQSRFTSTNRQPQVVVLNPGANDFSNPDTLNTEQFKTGYRSLILQVRNLNPKAQILCLEPIPFEYHAQVLPLIKQAVEELQAAGDHKLHFLALHTDKNFLPPQDFADSEHPLLQGHLKLADYLSKAIAEITGWK